jgi:hypothetical protein
MCVGVGAWRVSPGRMGSDRGDLVPCLSPWAQVAIKLEPPKPRVRLLDQLAATVKKPPPGEDDLDATQPPEVVEAA